MEAAGAVRLKGQKSVKFFLTALSAFADIGAPMKKKASFIQIGLSQPTASIDRRESRDGPTRRPMSKFRLICRSAIVIVTWSGFSALGTVYNSDETPTSIQYLHDNFAQNGDTITLPAGTFTWSAYVNVTKAITIQGQTTVSGDHTTTMTFSDQTIILDNAPRGGSNTLVYVHHSSGAFRITGITFRVGSVAGIGYQGTVSLESVSPATCRVDHCHFDGLRSNNIATEGNSEVYGVADHNYFSCYNHCLSFEIFHFGFGGHNYGDGAWAAPTNFGGSNFFFIEDNTINNPGTQTTEQNPPFQGPGPDQNNAQTIGAIDAYAGGRYVCRYNIWHNCIPTDHGTETPGRLRSVRAAEVYQNDITFDQFPGTGGLIRGGCALIYNNVYHTSGAGTTGAPNLSEYRSIMPFVFPAASGNFGFDLNSDTADHTGNGYGGGPNGLFASGIHNGAGPYDAVLSVAGSPWTTNQWVGYMLLNVTHSNSGGNGPRASFIVSNTANTITVDRSYTDPNADPNGNIYWANGDAFRIYKLPTAASDQCG